MWRKSEIFIVSIAVQVEEPVATRRGSTDGYQRRYLALFAESERMREQYLELKKSTTNKNEVLKRRGATKH